MYSKYSLSPFFGLVISHDLIPSNNARIFSSPVPLSPTSSLMYFKKPISFRKLSKTTLNFIAL
nr:hypothetical protein [Mycoplasmopsis bovis]